MLDKPGALTPAERITMESHVILGIALLQTRPEVAHLLPAIRAHHEAWDGSGYPDRVAGDRIPLGGRLLAIADTIDAMATARPYRTPRDPATIRAELLRCRGLRYDPALIDLVLVPATWAALWGETYPPLPNGLDAETPNPLTPWAAVPAATPTETAGASSQSSEETPSPTPDRAPRPDR